MTNEEAKKALMTRAPVIYDGVEYLYMTAISYRPNRFGQLTITGEMLDKSQRSVVVAEIKNIELKEQ